jgi:adenine-specific DNA methylase
VNKTRLIECAFPLKQASLDSVHEKNVRHGHISTLHIWPARRPLAACRAALIATLLPDPGNAEERKKLLEKLGGTVVEVVKKKKLPSGKVEEKKVEETVGGILHWGRESGPDLEWFRQKIREAYGGRAPKVLDPFAGGGAIPLEAMRLGCDVTAIDINPVAWFILKCTLEYPQKLAGQHRSLPKFALESPEFMEGFFKGTSKLTKKQLERNLQVVQTKLFPPPDVDLAWHVRAWGWWVLQCAKADLERFYPVVDSKPTVAYLWARMVTCKNCRATVPLLKTRWLCKKDNKRILLTMEPTADRFGVSFDVQIQVPVVGSNAAQRREHDKRIGAGTMSRSGATCPCCKAIMTMEDIRFEGQVGRLGTMMTAVVVDGKDGKEYRLPTENEIKLATEAKDELSRLFAEVPFGLPQEPLPSKEAHIGKYLSGYPILAVVRKGCIIS